MALFSKSPEIFVEPFNKDIVKADLVTLLTEKYPHIKYIEGDGSVYDFLLIKSIPIIRLIKINSLNPFEKNVETVMQEVLAVSIIDKDMDIDNHSFDGTSGWTKKHCIINQAINIRRHLDD